VVRAVDFFPSKAKLVLHINRRFGIKHKVLVVLIPQAGNINPKPFNIKIPNLFFVFKVKFLGVLFAAKKLVFKLFKLKCTKDKISGGNLVTKSLSDLSNTEWQFKPHASLNILEINILSLRRFRAKIYNRVTVLGNTSVSLKHKVKIPYGGPVTLAAIRATKFFLVDIFLHLLVRPSVTGDRPLA